MDASPSTEPTDGGPGHDAAPPPAPRRVAPLTWPGACAVVILSLVLLFPGAAPFIYDEPQILAEALAANDRGLPAHRGLTATFPYGPAPIWFYQLLLLVTREPVTLLAIRAGLFAVAVAASLLLIARATGWWRWGGLAIAASPYVWLYARQLWDASLLVPLSLASVACYAMFLRAGGTTPNAADHVPPIPAAGPEPGRAAGGWLFASMVLCGLGVLTHLMAIPLAAGLLTHAVVCRGGQLRASWRAAALGAAVVGVLSSSYVSVLVMYARYAPAGDSGVAPRPALIEAIGFLADAPRVFSARGLGYFFAEPDPRGFDAETGAGHVPYLHDAGSWSAAFSAASALTLGVYVLAAVGLARAAWAWRTPRDATATGDLLRAAAAVLAWQAVMVFATGRTTHPHYYGGVFGAHAVLIWAGTDLLARLRVVGRQAWDAGQAGGGVRERLARPGASSWWAGLFVLHVAACLTVTLLLAFRLHATDGTRGQRFGASLSTQTAAARLLAARPADAPFRNDTQVIPLSVFALENLLQPVRAPHPPRPDGGRETWVLRYARPAPHATLEVIVERAP